MRASTARLRSLLRCTRTPVGIAGCSAIVSLSAGNFTSVRAVSTGSVKPCLLPHDFDYDIITIGGGSGGLALAREAAHLSGKVLLFDYVHPSPAGTKWGIGGTCVNVGCIPKKLNHTAALLGQGMIDAAEYGWRIPPGLSHDWKALSSSVQSYIKGINFGYRTSLREEKVEYINAAARIRGPHEVEFIDPKTKAVRTVTARHIVVAVGGRPRYPEDVAGARELGITSDDLFWLKRPPGRTLLIGGGYIALECAGFLTHLGYPATVMVRGPVLRSFDQQMAEKIAEGMSATGTRFLRGARPLKLERVEPAPAPAGAEGSPSPAGIRVTWRAADEAVSSEVFDTVVFATGRAPATAGLGLADVGVALDADGKVIGGGPAAASSSSAAAAERLGVRDPWSETSSVPSIHAIGDVLAGRPELTPVAIRAGRLLAARLLRGELAGPAAPASACMDYSSVPTTVFTPIEYACVGLSEEQACAAHGPEGVDAYHLAYDTLELAVAHRAGPSGVPLPPQCYTKLLVTRGASPAEERVLGVHVLGPGAGEVIQGFAVALKLGATRAHLLDTVAIHPTHAEELLNLEHTKRSGESFVKTSC